MSKTILDKYWDQAKRRFGGFSSLNMKDEQNLKAVIASLITEEEASHTVESVSIDYERLGMVMYAAVKAALDETLPDKLQTYAVAEVQSMPIMGSTSSTHNEDNVDMPSSFFVGDGDSNFESVNADTVNSKSVSDSIAALRQMQGEN